MGVGVEHATTECQTPQQAYCTSYLIVTLYLSREKAIVIFILQVIQLRSRVVLWPAGDHTANRPHWDPSIALSLHQDNSRTPG